MAGSRLLFWIQRGSRGNGNIKFMMRRIAFVGKGLVASSFLRPPIFKVVVCLFLAAILLQYGSNFIVTQRYTMSRIYGVMLLVGQEPNSSTSRRLLRDANDMKRFGTALPRHKHLIARYLHKHRFPSNAMHSVDTREENRLQDRLPPKDWQSMGTDDDEIPPVRDESYGGPMSQHEKVELPKLEGDSTDGVEEGIRDGLEYKHRKNKLRAAGLFTPKNVNTLSQTPRRKQSRKGVLAAVWELIDRIRDGLMPPAVATTPQPLPPCPKRPPALQGTVSVILSAPDWSTLIKAHPEVAPGGRWRPSNCTARHKVAIIIPFRDRDAHLRIFLQHMHPFLQKQLIDYGIYVIDQVAGTPFNRAMLMNIGFVEAGKLYNYGCYIFHDVDLLPEVDYNMYTCPHLPRHMSVAVDTFGYRLPYQNLFGGVTALRADHFKNVNGFSNFFFGWGGEDDDFYNRIKHHGLDITRYPLHIARYRMINHIKAQPSDDRFKMLNTGRLRYETDGLNSLNYTLVAVDKRRLYTIVRVHINKTQVVSTEPQYNPRNLGTTSKAPQNVPDFQVHIPRDEDRRTTDPQILSARNIARAKASNADIEQTLLSELGGNEVMHGKRHTVDGIYAGAGVKSLPDYEPQTVQSRREPAKGIQRTGQYYKVFRGRRRG